MMPGESDKAIILEPQLDACIETQAKRGFNALLSDMMKREDEKLAEKLETLKLFLENEDFNRLRAESEPHLVKGEKVAFWVWQEQGKPEYEMRVE